MSYKPILCLDFDGVIHSYSSGWKGPRVITDPPVEGALQFICAAVERFEVHIFSSRSRYWFGRRSMKRYLRKHYEDIAMAGWDYTPDWFRHRISMTAFADPWPDEVWFAAKKLVGELKFPTEKPPALMTIDDRAQCFTGTFPSLDEIQSFKPWYKT